MIVTIHDVAKKSGYSITTVSRALNGYGDVNDKTRKKIIEVAKELNYKPNRVARSLVSKKLDTIGLFVLGRTSFQQGFIFDIVSGLMDEVSEHDFDLLIFGTQSLKTGLTFQQLCHQRGVGGAVITGLKINDPIIQELEKSDVPTILVDVPVKGKKATYITFDNQQGAIQAIDYLVSLGHKNIGFINGHREAWVCFERFSGYKKGLAKNNLPFKEDYIFYGDFTKESGQNGARQLKESNSELTAIFVASDVMAVGALEELVAMGFDVPNDISIIGFDDQDFAAFTNPTLSTIRQDVYPLGRVAAKNIIRLITDPEYEPEVNILNTSLIVRQSTSPTK